MLLPLLLLATLGMLVALPHIATAEDQGQNEGTPHQADHETNHEGRTIRFDIHLTGDQQVPAVHTNAFGVPKVRPNEDNSTPSFSVVVCNNPNLNASLTHF